jgi:hypothetical protein
MGAHRRRQPARGDRGDRPWRPAASARMTSRGAGTTPAAAASGSESGRGGGGLGRAGAGLWPEKLRRLREVDQLRSPGVTQARNRREDRGAGAQSGMEGSAPPILTRSGPLPGGCSVRRLAGWRGAREPVRARRGRTGSGAQPWGSRRDGPSIRIVVHWWRSRLSRAVTGVDPVSWTPHRWGGKGASQRQTCSVPSLSMIPETPTPRKLV